MPASESPEKSRIAFYATPQTIEDAKRLADLSGQTVSEVYRQALERGLTPMLKEELDRVAYRKRMQIEQQKRQGDDTNTGN